MSGKKGFSERKSVNFEAINKQVLPALIPILIRWLPDGMLEGHEYRARNPRRADRNIGSFSINTRTGRWADFATGDKGGDVISLAAYLFDKSQIDAARELAKMLGVQNEN